MKTPLWTPSEERKRHANVREFCAVDFGKYEEVKL